MYSVLVNDPGVSALAGTRVFQGESMITAQVEKPFLVFRIGNETSFDLSGEDVTPRRVFFQIYVHDSGPDYQRVDDLGKAVKTAFRVNRKSVANSIMDTIYLETSRDLDDPSLETIFRYFRFQLILSS